ncbi:hypothetical protein [Burkholderia sp. ISTR5]|uniref:hypothetical protein n=1 Tax=Burkholderia sp. ISTR5 TaxID=2500161 RepID=UPI00136C2F23|nr:hypothetical protein [Burkholderia sp. ISTR5]NBI50768.1 hypothetical protein [Burkholderia sp. ISTR5]
MTDKEKSNDAASAESNTPETASTETKRQKYRLKTDWRSAQIDIESHDLQTLIGSVKHQPVGPNEAIQIFDESGNVVWENIGKNYPQ